MLNLEKIGEKITVLRKQKGISQNELADLLFVTHQAVSKWEKGKSIPSIDILYELTKLFNVSIDYILQDAQIKENDYATKLKLLPRQSVISSFLKRDDLNNEIEKIFYLLNTSERMEIINLLLSGKVSIEPDDIWHVLSGKERMYLLGGILSNKYDYDLSRIYHKLTIEEERLVRSKYDEGVYYHKLPKKRGGIL